MDRLFRNILRDALEEIASEVTEMYSDFSEISKDSSNEKEALIDRYIKASRSIALKHRIAIIVIAAIIIAFSSCAIYLFKEEIGGFFVTHFNDHANLEYGTNEYTSIDTYYELTYIPDGFTKTESDITDLHSNITYTDETSEIFFSQSLLGTGFINIDTENTEEYGEIDIGDVTAIYTKKRGIWKVIWRNHSCSFGLTCYDSMSFEEVKKIVLGIKPVQQHMST